MFGGLGMGEMVLIFLVVLLLFGAKRLPEIGSSLGKGIREFKSSVRDVESELKQPRYTPPPLPEPRSQLPGTAAPQAPAQTQAQPQANPTAAPASSDKPTA
jgi:sec-independent protein translocase protein TatA